MKEEQFDPLDQAMRQAAEFYEPPFDEAAWQNMNAMLDAREKRRKRVLGWWWLPDVATVLVIGMFVAGGRLQPNPEVNHNNASGGISAGASKGVAQNDVNHLLVQKQESETLKEAPAMVVIRSSGMGSKTKNAMSASGPADESFGTISSKREVSQKDYILNVPDKAAGASKQVTDKNSNQGSALVLKSEHETMAQAHGEPTTNQNLPVIDSMAGNAPLKAPRDSNTTKTGTPQAVIIEPGKATSKRKNTWLGRFSITGVAGAEVTKSKSRPPGDPTMVYGGLLGYTTGRFTFQAGVQSATKLYAASGDDYKPRTGSYWSYVTLQNVDAECRVLELPVLVRYDFGNLQKGHFFLSGGLATAIMEKEEYYYDYKRMNGQQAYANYDYSTGNVHWLSSAVLSAGYAKPIQKKLNFSAQSFYKLPLQGVGEGSILIQSFGVQAGLSYYPF